ncbi:ATP-dependent helicase [Micromonospora tulbaghiae]|uniref:ATP-dependent helicase n=1 Tax=Micromonospora tulbaghiae TaxID=479978 RepID=UPI0033AC9CFD
MTATPRPRESDDADEIRLPVGEVLLLAAPGCGKTERLAQHAAEMVRTGEVRQPHQILALTFAKRARTNLDSRIRTHLGPVAARRHVDVVTFHSFAHRLFRNHGTTIGGNPLLLAPQDGWLKELCRTTARVHGVKVDVLTAALVAAKRALITDEEVHARLGACGLPAAMAYQERLDAEGRLDFDDILRYGVRLLALPAVLDLYRARYTAVLVDEAQDLNPLQYLMVHELGRGKIVFGGDQAQGIFRFAGADPDWVFAQIRARNPTVVRLDCSHRSSPAVLRAVSSLATELGGQPLECAEPDKWQGRGRVAILRSPDVYAEANAVINQVQTWLAEDPMASIGVMARAGTRRAYVDQAVRTAGIAAEIWDDPMYSARVVELLRTHAPAAIAAADTDESRIDELQRRCHEAVDPDDLDLRDDITSACVALHERTDETPLTDSLAAIRVAGDPDLPTGAGLHLLSGHSGKGQQFTKVIIVGLEEGFMPHYAAIKSNDPNQIRDELAVLHVMASRAREDLLVTVAADVPNWRGEPLRRDPSRWLPLIEAVTTDPHQDEQSGTAIKILHREPGQVRSLLGSLHCA